MNRQMTKSPPTFMTLHQRGQSDARVEAHQKNQDGWRSERAGITEDILSKENAKHGIRHTISKGAHK